MHDRTRVRAIQFGVNLAALLQAKRYAKGRWKTLCPLHEDKRPSLQIRHTDARGWRWSCFVCNDGGDAVDLLVKRDEMSFLEALDALDGGQPLPAPPPERETYWKLLVCDACRNEFVKLRDFAHLCDLRDQATCVPEWEIAPDFIAAIGPLCLGARNAAYVDFGGENEVRQQRRTDPQGARRRRRDG